MEAENREETNTDLSLTLPKSAPAAASAKRLPLEDRTNEQKTTEDGLETPESAAEKALANGAPAGDEAVLLHNVCQGRGKDIPALADGTTPADENAGSAQSPGSPRRAGRAKTSSSSPTKRGCNENADDPPASGENRPEVGIAQDGGRRQGGKARRRRDKKPVKFSTPSVSRVFTVPPSLPPAGKPPKHQKPTRHELEDHQFQAHVRAKDEDAARPRRRRSKSAEDTPLSLLPIRADLPRVVFEDTPTPEVAPEPEKEPLESPIKVTSPTIEARGKVEGRRAVRHTKTWEALKGFGPIGKLARASDRDRWKSNTVDVVYSLLEFSGDVAVSVADAVLGPNAVDKIDTGMSKLTGAAHNTAKSAMTTSAYKTVARTVSYFWQNTWPGRALISTTGHAARATERLSGVTRKVHKHGGVAYNLRLASGDRKLFFLCPRFLSFLFLCCVYCWARLFLLCHTVFLFLRDSLTENPEGSRGQGSARTLPYSACASSRADPTGPHEHPVGWKRCADRVKGCTEEHAGKREGQAEEEEEKDGEVDEYEEEWRSLFYQQADRVLGGHGEQHSESEDASDPGDPRVRRRTPVKRRVAAMRGGRYPFQLTAPPPTPHTKTTDELSLRQCFICLLRKLPVLSDVLRDPRDPPPMAFLFGAPTYITDDKIRRLLEASPPRETEPKQKRKLDDLYPPEMGTYAELDLLKDYVSDEDPDYVPEDESGSTDSLEYTEEDESGEEDIDAEENEEVGEGKENAAGFGEANH